MANPTEWRDERFAELDATANLLRCECGELCDEPGRRLCARCRVKHRAASQKRWQRANPATVYRHTKAWRRRNKVRTLVRGRCGRGGL